MHDTRDKEQVGDAQATVAPASTSPLPMVSGVPRALLQRKIQRRALQRKAAGEEAAAEETAGESADPDEPILKAGEEAVAADRHSEHTDFDTRMDGSEMMFVFRDPDVQKLFRHLVEKWLGASMDAVNRRPNYESPYPWVGELRAKTLTLRPDPEAPKKRPHAWKMAAPTEKETRLAELARKLCDAAAAKTEAEQYRENVVKSADKGIGKVSVTSQEVKDSRAIMPNYTSCGDTMTRELAGAEMPEGGVRPKSPQTPVMHMKADSRPDFVPFTVGDSRRPRPGDVLIFKKMDSGDFQHTSILRRINPLGDDAKETWYTVDGGNESLASTDAAPTAERESKFDPSTGVFAGSRRVHGWIDIEKMYQEAQQNPPAKK